MRKVYSIPLVLFAFVMVASAADTVIEEIVARINSSIITRNDLEKAKEQIVTESREKGLNPDQSRWFPRRSPNDRRFYQG